MMSHIAVLQKEVIAGLAVIPDGIYIDATFGRGGHAASLLEYLSPAGRLYALDKDWAAVAYAEAHFARDKRFHIVQGSFGQLADLARQWNIVGRVAGIMLDLGVSSPQLDDAARGFSFMHSGPLDMRMNQQQTANAAIFINQADESLLADVFFKFGEERFARRIARAIVQARATMPITDTAVLAAIIKDAHPQWDKHKHPATRVFQAIRIYVNQELADLEAGLTQSLAILAPQGRLAVISFHSLEDRLVKQFMQQQERGIQLPKHIPIKSPKIGTGFKRIGKAIKPSIAEIQNNRRARSAILRIGEKQV